MSIYNITGIMETPENNYDGRRLLLLGAPFFPLEYDRSPESCHIMGT
jgi:hypothetical protein